MADNVTPTRAGIEAMKRGDMDAMAAGIAEDAVWHIAGSNPFSGDFSGREAIMQRFATMAQAGAGITIDEIHDVVGNDEHAVALVRLTIRGPGGETSQPSVWVFHGQDGIATELWSYASDQAEIDRVYSG